MACGGVPLALGARASAWPPRRPILMCAVAEPQETEHVEDAKRVAEYWKSLGMTVRTVNPTTHPTVFAEGGAVLRASFDTNAADKSYRVGATAVCSTGDAWELNVEDQAERDQGKVLPGDEGVVVREDSTQ